MEFVRTQFPTKHARTRVKLKKKSQWARMEFTSDDLFKIELLAKLGATNAQLALYFGVHMSTIEDWHRRYPEFKEAVKRGGLEADMKVAESLFKRATGYEYIEEEYSAVEVNGDKVPLNEMRLVRRIKKQVIPDTKAAIHWLKVRQRETWLIADQSVVNHVGSINHLHKKIQEIPVDELTPKAQKVLFEIAQKQLSVGS